VLLRAHVPEGTRRKPLGVSLQRAHRAHRTMARLRKKVAHGRAIPESEVRRGEPLGLAAPSPTAQTHRDSGSYPGTEGCDHDPHGQLADGPNDSRLQRISAPTRGAEGPPECCRHSVGP